MTISLLFLELNFICVCVSVCADGHEGKTRASDPMMLE